MVTRGFHRVWDFGKHALAAAGESRKACVCRNKWSWPRGRRLEVSKPTRDLNSDGKLGRSTESQNTAKKTECTKFFRAAQAPRARTQQRLEASNAQV
eukprot:364311-Chlamydomonas_euryale.AAC.2